ncbi:MAG TPA: cobalt ECF transporter T component CbiQ [Isosphaeraceae bacterium]|jgi:cobalt/nickel transport system permease protein|nr:cobalt ECF transporter T component CbiQ [Isosphaeraceae bacterium]
MRPEALEPSVAAGPVARLDARAKLVATLGFVVAVVATPAGSWRPLAAEGLVLAFAIGLAGVEPLGLFRRWLAFLPLFGFLAATLAFSRTHAGGVEMLGVALSILARNTLALLALLTLAGVTPFRDLLGALRRLGAPAVLVATLHFMYRYLFIFGEELGRMARARRSRTFRRSGRLDWGLLSGLIGVLLLRALERGERVHDAMLARGWDGTIRTLDGADAP